MDLDPAKLGYGVGANLYIKVETRHLHAAGTAITTHGPTMFVAVVSGPANLQATVVSPTVDALYDYPTSTLAQVPGITDIETSLTRAFIKHARTAWR
ncbi:Lrp/AsnC family transcriptional regulator [Mycobacterium sp. 141]|uniref:Lrp/AsnC family transcriptional regulator n=1 Tax=Mycobacterium sp. 141 TaxID=1120797 RepID=UPI00035F856A|nr:Lrp/AsnC family transcriptional regulator [Mycobacterium sp. 141]